MARAGIECLAALVGSALVWGMLRCENDSSFWKATGMKLVLFLAQLLGNGGTSSVF